MTSILDALSNPSGSFKGMGARVPSQISDDASAHQCFVFFFLQSRLGVSFSSSFFFKACLFLKRQSEQRRGKKEKERGDPKQAPSTLPAQSPMWGSNSWTVRSWPELKSGVGHLTN